MVGRAATLVGAARSDRSGPRPVRTLLVACIAHALHDGVSDMNYVLLPVWQAQFGLSYGALALVRALFNGAMAGLQVPAARLASRFGARSLLALGTLLTALGYAAAGFSGGLVGLCVALAVAGAGSSTQHPLASAAVSRAYGASARGPLGTYNLAGDVGKAIFPAAVSLLLTRMHWPRALIVVALVTAAVALLVRVGLPTVPAPAPGPVAAAPARAGGGDKGGFGLLVAIGVLDSAARMGFLLFLPFLLRAEGAKLTTVGLALSLVFVGGAGGKAICGWFAHRIGLLATVIVTEAGTAAAILALLALPLLPSLLLLPLLGLMLNGTSSVLYGTVPELVPEARIERAFSLFYTGTLGSSALSPILFGQVGDFAGPHWGAAAAAFTALAVLPPMLILSPRLRQ